jgi:predicted RNase H-like HicB family nuclease
MLGKEKRSEHPTQNLIPVLCKFWKEDGVWNASAEHLPIAVFGDTFEDALKNLRDAIISHIQSVREAGQIDQLISLLLKRAQDHMLVTEITPEAPLVKMLVPQDYELVTDCA